MSQARVRAPELTARGGWLNTAAPVTLQSLRGRFVLLDFWTFCCANCLHVLDELRPLEHRHAQILTVVGVHSPKFTHEADHAAVRAAVARHAIEHPVLDDPDLRLWREYAVRAWPTLVLIDPEGYVVAQAAGEGQASAMEATLVRLAEEHARRGTLRRGPAPARPAPRTGSLHFPAKAVLVPAARTGRDADTLLVADAGHHQLAELSGDARTVLRRIGSGVRGHRDGPAGSAQFAEPNGVALLPPGLAADIGYDLVVADTANHVLRGVRLADGAVPVTLDLPAALAPARTVTGAVPAVLSPWDVAWWPARDHLVVAAAGVHLLLRVDPRDGAVQVLAGNTVEGLRDGPAGQAWLAQPSGLAVAGDRVWFVDAETSALRWIDTGAVVHTAVGEGLFDFGHVDGPAATARLQHPLGVTALPDGSVAVLDTYNGAVRRFDPDTGLLGTVARGLAEPSGAVLVHGELLVVESAAHRLVRPDPASAAADPQPAPAAAGQRPVTALNPGPVHLQVLFTPPPGRHLDDRDGPPTRLTVSASPPELLLAGAGGGTGLSRRLQVNGGVTGGVLHVSAQAASCDDATGAEHPACYLSRQDWGIPVRVDGAGAGALPLVLLD